ncbi:unnamed protein product (macronuclear) [Paramecium tetraurelia]|uniref:IBB domain-containing protein n=1 Tax=Paramecium tetraurelia TaxID=5888 RepID=A0E545_PARTE|nr:uncharacterized protein GSPATT00023589001 [Paramecium tetraurelia]CAK90412.1 unnamed protein product [Paramecium tetraurelia]|eukprot:XP_001457809.1 hypothetical protein (macronuclear) [Paramecium tetraurelia strain d4-2]
MLQQKKEQFRQEIRKQGLDKILNQRRQILLSENAAQQFQDGINDQIILLYNQIEVDNSFDIYKSPLLKPILEGDLTNQLILLLQLIVKKCRDANQIEYLETFFEDSFLGSRLLSKCENEKSLVFLDEQLYLLGQLSQSSLLCQSTLIQLNIGQTLKKILDLEFESDDYLMSTFMYLITTFIEPNSGIHFQDVQEFMSILDQLCKKLRGINYLIIELDLEKKDKYTETKNSLLNRILLFARYFIDKSQFTVNLTLYPNFWVILTNLAFVVQEQSQLRQIALQVISDSIKLNDQKLKFDIIEKYPDIFCSLLNIIDHNYKSNGKFIRTQASIIMKQLFSEQSQYIIQNIHLNQIPLQLMIIIASENDRQVLYHQLECLFLLCSNSSFEQCTDLYNNGLLTLLISKYQEIKECQDYVLSKWLLQLTLAVLQHNSSGNSILNLLKQYQITSYLKDIAINCKNENTSKRANQLLKYIN